MIQTRINRLFSIEYPIIQAGMIWCSNWALASAVSNAGGLGLLGSGSMYPDELRENIRKCKEATNKPFGVNIPLLYPDIDKHIDIVISEGVKIIFTSAGNPKTWTKILKEKGITVVHVVSSVKFAIKCEEAGVDAVVAEGFEAGGHNGREETTTLVLIPAVAEALNIPLIAAGGIRNGKGILACLALGAEGVQMGSRFVMSKESPAHPNFKQAILNSQEGGTMLSMKQLTPVRLLKNPFFERVQEAELKGASKEELTELLGRARAKKGMFEGDIIEGELEIGQIASYMKEIQSVKDIFSELLAEYQEAKQRLINL